MVMVRSAFSGLRRGVMAPDAQAVIGHHLPLRLVSDLTAIGAERDGEARWRGDIEREHQIGARRALGAIGLRQNLLRRWDSGP